MLGRTAQCQLDTVGREFAARHLASAGWIANVIAMVEEDHAQPHREPQPEEEDRHVLPEKEAQHERQATGS